MNRRHIGAGLAAATVAVTLLVTPVSADGTLLQGTVGFQTEQFLTHWWIFPAAILFSTVALASGVSGALFFTPFFLLIVGLTHF
mgnify:FL=1